MWPQSLPFLLGCGFLFSLLFWREGENGSFRDFRLAFSVGSAASVPSGTVCFLDYSWYQLCRIRIGEFWNEDIVWLIVCAGTVELDGPSELSPLGVEGGQAFKALHFPVFGNRQLPLAVPSSRRHSERGSQPAFPAGSRMSAFGPEAGSVGTTQQPLSYACICF